MGGGDKLFKKRKARQLSELKRRQARRSPYDRVLIVCEGETEEKYFKGLVRSLQLNTANIRIPSNTAGASPRNVVEFAIEEYNLTKDYDRVYCVIDKDEHSQYREALDLVKRRKLKKSHSLRAVPSVPCFEFWILLHFKMTTRSFYNSPGPPCMHVIKELKPYIPEYEKASATLFDLTRNRLNEAVQRAEKVLAHSRSAATDDPSTRVHELVLYLKQLKQ
ncbi:MAG: RloB family protein [Desulfotignum sp.]|nr:RloB family protein [Desulfotignum sp.]MCF8089190.1 RloB family protein [Desulfotignum sp.]MCF8136308.1 RloB family protein [Desulfotignum sp.]